MDDEQLLRYSRHLLLPEIDIDGQEKWRQARILIIGAGGVGDLALTYGYERLNFPLMLFTVVVLIAFVQIIQTIGSHLAFKVRHH